MDSLLTTDNICKKQCMDQIALYIKVKNDFTITYKSLIETIDKLKTIECYTTLVSVDNQKIIDANLATLNNIVLQ